MLASEKGHTETVKILVEQKRIDINAKNFYLFLPIFNVIFYYFKIIFGNYSNYYLQRLCMHLFLVAQKQSKYLLNKKELI